MIQKKHLYSFINIQKNWKSFQLLSNNQPFKPFKRVYHHHLMKTGGTSINKMFLSLTKSNEDLYTKLMRSNDKRIIEDKFVFSAWNHIIIASGLFHYAWSHRPFENVLIPSNTFIISSFRNPYDRIYSRYKHLVNDLKNGLMPKNNMDEYKRLGNNFDDYLENIPEQELCHQLYMFSKQLNVREAMKNLKKVNYIIDLNTFEHDILQLNKILNIDLVSVHARENRIAQPISFNLEDAFSNVPKIFQKEIEFYTSVLDYKNSKSGV